MGATYYAVGKNTWEVLELQYSGRWRGDTVPPAEFFLADDFEGPRATFKLPFLTKLIFLPKELFRVIFFRFKNANPDGVDICQDDPHAEFSEQAARAKGISPDDEAVLVFLHGDFDQLKRYVPELCDPAVIDQILKDPELNPFRSQRVQPAQSHDKH
jgi:hypothetical protein